MDSAFSTGGNTEKVDSFWIKRKNSIYTYLNVNKNARFYYGVHCTMLSKADLFGCIMNASFLCDHHVDIKL